MKKNDLYNRYIQLDIKLIYLKNIKYIFIHLFDKYINKLIFYLNNCLSTLSISSKCCKATLINPLIICSFVE